MKLVVAAVAVLALVAGAQAIEQRQVAAMIEKLNSNPAKTWEAGWNENWQEFSFSGIKKLMGWNKTLSQGKTLPRAPIVPGFKAPAAFNSITNWPQCSTIGAIQNQARCGSCWAFGCIESVSDRFCISSNATFNQMLSFEDLVSCGPDDGCEGGEPGDAWQWVQENGVVTDKCYPYSVPTCAPQQQPCLNFVPTPQCQQSQTCADGKQWKQYYTKSTYGVGPDQNQIMAEIATNGPVEACFSVYEDFVHYKSGVYQHTSGGYLGGHCVKIVGYGTENGTPYWLINNSWTTYWGDKGQFKILRGQDECGIEDQVVAGMAGSV